MAGPVLKPHPRRAVWVGRLSEYGIALATFVTAAINALTGDWSVVPPWLVAGIVALIYQHRLGSVWSWGWREGHDEAVRRIMPNVHLNHENVTELHDALAGETPTWRQRQDELAQIDVKATIQASMEELEQIWTNPPIVAQGTSSVTGMTENPENQTKTEHTERVETNEVKTSETVAQPATEGKDDE